MIAMLARYVEHYAGRLLTRELVRAVIGRPVLSIAALLWLALLLGVAWQLAHNPELQVHVWSSYRHSLPQLLVAHFLTN